MDVRLFTLPSTEQEAVKFLQDRGVFPKQQECPASPDHETKLFFTVNYGIYWRCSRNTCSGRRISIKNGTWFYNRRVPLAHALRLLYSWAMELKMENLWNEQLGPDVCVDWNRCIRDVISEDLDQRPCKKIGGEGRIVEIDEAAFAQRRHADGTPHVRMVSGMCRVTGQCFLKLVPDQSNTAILNVVKDNVAEGSVIYSNWWSEDVTSELEAAGFRHLRTKLRHPQPTTVTHNGIVHPIWGPLKWQNKRLNREPRQYPDSYLVEFVWRQEIGDKDPFEALLESIKRVSSNNNPCSRVRQVELNSNLQQVVESIVQAARVEEHRRNAIENLPESCPACDMRLKNVTDLLMHANEVHEFEGVVKEEVFPSFDAFESWKEVVNRKHNTCWIRKHERTDQMMFYRHLRCYRCCAAFSPRQMDVRRFTLPSTEREAVKFLQDKGVFAKQLKCPTSPDHEMKLFFMENCGIYWMCLQNTCFGRRISIKNGTWFHYRRVPLVNALRLLYSWAMELRVEEWWNEQLGPDACKGYYRDIRDLISEDLDRRPCEKIGGKGRIVEVDEVAFAQRRRAEGTPLRRTVSGMCRETGQCFLKLVPYQSRAAILNVIKDNVAEGSVIYSNCCSEHETLELEAAGLCHLRARRRLRFYPQPTTVVHNGIVHPIWGPLKWQNKRVKLQRQIPDPYLVEFVWRQEIGDKNPFEALLETIKRVSSNNNHCSRVRQVEMNSQLQQMVENPVHGARIEEHRRSATENLPESCPACDMRLKTVTDLLMHVKEVHKFDAVVKEEVFPSFAAFECWKEAVDKKYNACWIRRHERIDQLVFYRHLGCYRHWMTGEHTTSPSSGAVENTCTAFMNVKRQMTSDVTNVEYCLDHFGHDQEPRQPPLFESGKPEIPDVLEQSVSVVETARARRKRNSGALVPEPPITVEDVKRIVVKAEAEPPISEAKESTSRDVRARTRSHRTESSVAEATIKEEPTSAMTWLAEPSSTRKELSPVEAKPPSDDGVRVFTLTAAPDGKGFALVDQPTCTDEAQQVL